MLPEISEEIQMMKMDMESEKPVVETNMVLNHS